MGGHLVFAPLRLYGLSVAVWWYILVILLVELFVSQGLIKEESTAGRKHQLEAKSTKMAKK